MRQRVFVRRLAVFSRFLALAGAVCALLIMAGCAGPSPRTAAFDAEPDAGTAGSGGRYAMNADAYPLDPPDVSQVPDAVPRAQLRSRAGNKATYTVWGKSYRVLPDATGYDEVGTASWYGKKFHGYATSSGEIYDMYRMSAAHRSLPLPTFARVTRVGTEQSVIVRVNDRGPFHSDRIIDLSYAAAARLDLLDHGTGRVRVEAIDPETWSAQQKSTQAVDPAPSSAAVPAASQGGTYWQVAALESRTGAQKLKRRLQDELEQRVRIARGNGVHRVQVGPIAPGVDDKTLRAALRRAGFPRAFIVR
ncbi:septal ring lytic transglycosylase RlpA family protein [Halomonas cibimaris]|uniref:Endolytic peptidoglycan transglycosylase RlpA n=1 Tax=Halomonas cibimaris TaxID=657012 RepID=A0ABP7LSX7_9GAMM